MSKAKVLDIRGRFQIIAFKISSFRPNPFHATYFLNVYNLSSIHLNKILFKPRYRVLIVPWMFYSGPQVIKFCYKNSCWHYNINERGEIAF